MHKRGSVHLVLSMVKIGAAPRTNLEGASLEHCPTCMPACSVAHFKIKHRDVQYTENGVC